MLFDIDGTLVRTGGIGARVFVEALETVLGRLPKMGLEMAGKTDPQIVREYLDLMHEDRSHSSVVLAQLEKGLAAVAHQIADHGRALPGVAELLARLHADQRVVTSVLTGNIAPNAVVKLAAFGLDRWLDLEIGAYGSDHEDRRRLVPIARRRAVELRGIDVDPDRIWVVGDTPRDLACAQAGGARCLLVGTGSYTAEDLDGLGADAVRPDLESVDEVYDLLTAA